MFLSSKGAGPEFYGSLVSLIIVLIVAFLADIDVTKSGEVHAGDLVIKK